MESIIKKGRHISNGAFYSYILQFGFAAFLFGES